MLRRILKISGRGNKLREAGAIFADTLNAQKARILLMLLLRKRITGPVEIQRRFLSDSKQLDKPIRKNLGEFRFTL